MKLLTKSLTNKLPPLDTPTDDNSPVYVHYFNPYGIGNWYGLTYDPEQKLFYGYVSLFGDHNDELGYFSLTELETFKAPPFGMPLERDLYWDDTTTLAQVKAEVTR